MHLLTTYIQVMPGVLAVKREIATAFIHRVFDHRAWKSEPLILAVNGSDCSTGFYAVRRGLRKSDLFENSEHGIVDSLYIDVFQWSVLAANFTGMNRLQVIGKRCFSQCNFGLSATGTSCHFIFPQVYPIYPDDE